MRNEFICLIRRGGARGSRFAGKGAPKIEREHQILLSRRQLGTGAPTRELTSTSSWSAGECRRVLESCGDDAAVAEGIFAKSPSNRRQIDERWRCPNKVRILVFLDSCHYNSSTLEKCHYNSVILKVAITILHTSEPCHFIRLLRAWARC